MNNRPFHDWTILDLSVIHIPTVLRCLLKTRPLDPVNDVLWCFAHLKTGSVQVQILDIPTFSMSSIQILTVFGKSLILSWLILPDIKITRTGVKTKVVIKISTILLHYSLENYCWSECPNCPLPWDWRWRYNGDPKSDPSKTGENCTDFEWSN